MVRKYVLSFLDQGLLSAFNFALGFVLIRTWQPEEFGLFACLVIVSLYAFVVLRGYSRSQASDDLFALLASAGLLAGFGLQALVNMASALGLIPTKGMTLPFLSYGGSSLLALGLGMGMVLALTRRRDPLARAP